MTQTIRIACRSANGPEIREVPAEWISESGRLAIHAFERDGERTYTVPAKKAYEATRSASRAGAGRWGG